MSQNNLKKILSEKKVETYLTRECFKRGWFCWKLVSPNLKGVPDRMILANYGIMVLVECKSSRGKLSVLQGRTIRKLQDKQQAIFVVASYEEVDNVVKSVESALESRHKQAHVQDDNEV